MRLLGFYITGVCFGIIMYRSEAASWYRIYEMFRFGSFHMYGIMATAVITGAAGVAILKWFRLKSLHNMPLNLEPKQPGITRYALGGFIFGMGWALTGACPGPIYVLIGAGFLPVVLVLFGALVGTFCYGLVRQHLPH